MDRPTISNNTFQEIVNLSIRHGVPLTSIPRERRESIGTLFNQCLQDSDKNEYELLTLLETSIYEKNLRSFQDKDFFLKQIQANLPEIYDEIEKESSDFGLYTVKRDSTTGSDHIIINGKTLYLSECKIGATNSVLQLYELLGPRVYDQGITSLKIRPNCFKVIPTHNWFSMEKARWYGKPFNTKIFDGIYEDQVIEHVPNDSKLSQGHYTQFHWTQKSETELQLIIEELPEKHGDQTKIKSYQTTRSLHALFDCKNKYFTHLDGGVNIYTKEEYLQRLQGNPKDNSFTFEKFKIFRLDGKIDFDYFSKIVESFYKWNPIAIEYFCEQ